MKTAICLVVMMASGCGAIFHGSTDTVAVSSNVDRATVQVDGAAVTQTPGEVTLSSSHPHTVSVRAPGYRESFATINTEVGAGWVVLDCLWLIPGVIPGVVALIVDGASGDWREASPERVHLELERDAQAGLPAVAPSGVPAASLQPWAAARDGVVGSGAGSAASPAAVSAAPAGAAPSGSSVPASSALPAMPPPPPPPPAK